MYKVAIRNTETNEVRVRTYDGESDKWSKARRFLWEEGNFCCDCNRRIEFERAAGIEIDQDNLECSAEVNIFTIDYVELPDGDRIEIE